jgi:hypothetical protein
LFSEPRVSLGETKNGATSLKSNTPFFFHFFKNCKTQNSSSNTKTIHPNTFTKVPEARITHFSHKKVKELELKKATVAKKRLSSNRGIQKPNQVIFNTIQLVFMSRCFLVCSFAPICTESWVCVLVWKLYLLRFCLSMMIRWKLLAYSWSVWKIVQSSVFDCWFWCWFVFLGFKPVFLQASSMAFCLLLMKKMEVEDDDVATRHWLPPV